MLSAQTLLAAIYVASSGVQASAIAPPFIVNLMSRDDNWTTHWQHGHYPPNERVCDMMTNKGNHTWTSSMVSDYFSTWMDDNDGDLRMVTLALKRPSTMYY